MSTATRGGTSGNDGGDKKRGGDQDKKQDGKLPSTPKKTRGKYKKVPKETPNADGSLKFLDTHLFPDAGIRTRFQGFREYYHPSEDFIMTPGKSPIIPAISSLELYHMLGT